MLRSPIVAWAAPSLVDVLQTLAKPVVDGVPQIDVAPKIAEPNMEPEWVASPEMPVSFQTDREADTEFAPHTPANPHLDRPSHRVAGSSPSSLYLALES